jgi:Flp pilus assembly protein TadD
MHENRQDPASGEDAETYIRKARHAIQRQDFDQAEEFLRRALSLNDQQPATHNLLGVLHEVRGERLEAQNSYRKALNLDATYGPARANLRESVEPHPKQSFMLAELKRSSFRDQDAV